MTSTQIQQRKGLNPHLYTVAPKVNFLWRTKKGKYEDISTLKTRHLVNLIKMVWNNTAPEECRFPNALLYTFAPVYTPEYFAEAVVSTLHELSTRDDITAYHQWVLEKIYDHLNPPTARRLESRRR